MSFRVKGAERLRKDYAHSLPVYTVDSVFAAQELIRRVSDLKWIGGGPAMVLRNWSGDIHDIPKVTVRLREEYNKMMEGV